MSTLTYFTVTGTFLAALKDSVYDVDNDPELAPMSGAVTFTPLIDSGDSLPATTLIPASNLFLVPVKATIRSGVITCNGATGVKLVANTAVLGLTGNLYYRVDFGDGLTAGGKTYSVRTYDFQAPTSATTVDLVEVTPVAGQPATGPVPSSAVLSVAGRTGNIVVTAADVVGAESTANKNTANGYAGLDGSGKILPAALPAGVLTNKGSTDCSGNPNYPSAVRGDAYVVTVAGKIGGASGKSVDVGDVYFATADNAGGTQASVGTSWAVLEHNLVGAVLAANNLSDVTNAAAARANIGAVGPLNNRTVAIGDSITAAGSTGYLGLLGDMWFNHLCMDTEQRIQYAGYFATAGLTLASIQSTHLPTVLAMNPLPGACVVFGGTNDMGAWGTGGASFAASKATLRAIVASLLAVGVVPILCTIPPITNSTDAVNQNTVTWNTWVRRYAAANGYQLVDANAALLGSDGHYASGVGAGDGVHPNQKGHRLIAQRAIDDGVFEAFPAAQVGTSRSSADLSNLFGSGSASYGLFLTNSGGVATGLTATGTGYTASIVTPTTADDLQGNWQQLSRTTGNTGTVTLASGGMSGWSVGDVVAFSFRVQAEQLFESATTFYVMLWNGGGPSDSHAGLYQFESDVDGLFYVEYPVPAGAAFLYWELQMSAVGGTGNPTVRLGEVTVRNLTTGGVLT